MRKTPAYRRAVSLAKKAGWDAAQIQDAQDVRAVLDGCWYDAAAGAAPIEFFASFLRHSKGAWAGEPFTLLPWQDAITRRLFGWKRRDGTRRFRRAYVEVPKKNGKSTWAAGLELFLLVGDGEPGAEVYCVAGDRDQASIVFNEAANMVRRSAELTGILDLIDSRKRITFPGRQAVLSALSADAPTKEGLNIHALVFDELHAQRNRVMWDTLQYGGIARRQPLLIAITTAGIYDEGAIGWEQHEYARRILSDEIHDWTQLAVIYGVGEKDDWTSPATWRRANPSLGVTIREDDLADACRRAQESPAEQNAFRRYRLNQWVQQVTRWIDMGVWAQNVGHPITEASLAGRTCYGGVDLGSVSDLSAWALIAPCEHTEGAVDVFVRCWVPEAQLANAKNPNRDLYQQWVNEGYLFTTPGNVTDYDYIEQQILDDAERLDLVDLAIDKLFQAQQLATSLQEAGLQVLPMSQRHTAFAAPMKELQRLLEAGQFHHGNHPVLRWMADNVTVKADTDGNLKIVKPSQTSAKKVDGLVAAVMALDRYARHAGEAGSDYEREGLMVL